MTTSIRPVRTAAGVTHRHNIRTREGRDLMRMVQGTEPGQYEMTQYGVVWHGKNELWTLIPWTNILVIEPTT